MKIGILSDLHLDHQDWDYNLPTGEGDVLVIAGDTLPAVKLAYPDRHPEWAGQADRVHGFLDHIVPRFNKTIYLLGNHEHDWGVFNHTGAMVRKALAQHPIFVMDNQIAEIGDYVFYAGTCWGDLWSGDAQIMKAVNDNMPEYRIVKIQDALGGLQTLTPRHTMWEHNKWRNGLQEAKKYALGLGKDLIVATHHCPSPQSSHARYAGDLVNYGFYSHLECLMRPEIPLWIHGHTHDSYDYRYRSTRVVCNPRGYGPRSLNPKFIPNLVLEMNRE